VRGLDFVVFPGKNNTYDLHIFEPITKFRKKCIENILKIDSNHRENTTKPKQNSKNLKFFQKTRVCGNCSVAGSDPSMVSSNYHEKYGPVVMEMASAKAEIRHFFGFTFFCRAGPPVI
jgi:hypothetical protein